MLRSDHRVRTTHGGNLPPATGNFKPGLAGDALVNDVAATITKQAECGVDCIGDGEYWVNRGFFYYGQQMGVSQRHIRPGEIAAGREMAREREEFPNLYRDMDRAGTMYCTPGETPMVLPWTTRWEVTKPISSIGVSGELQRELTTFKDALKVAGKTDAETFVCVQSTGWIGNFVFDAFYNDAEKYFFALADAMKAEYRAVTDAGFILQLDDPALVTVWDMVRPAQTLEQYRRSLEIRVAALNHALSGIPEDRLRVHFCWGSWHGPHTHDLPLKDVVDIVLKVRVQGYYFEAGNVRHQHEWTIWRDVKLPDDKILIPGVVSHATNIVEHPELVAERLKNFASIVGRENVMAGTDCGLGGRVHADIVWAKLKALSEGAQLASKALWAR